MTSFIGTSPSTCTTALGYRPNSLDRVVSAVVRAELHGMWYPVRMAACLVTATVQQVTPAWNVPARQQVGRCTEPAGQDDFRDYLAERGFRVASINTTGHVVVRPGTGELTVTGFAPTVAVSNASG